MTTIHQSSPPPRCLGGGVETTLLLLTHVVRETAQAWTPGMAATVRSILPLHAAHDMPLTLNENS